jgi:elongation factor 1-gamma
MKIYNNHANVNLFVDIGVITAALAKVQVEEVFVSEEEMKSKDWKQKSITGKCPMLETPSGNLVESAAIARYIARLGEGNLNGADALQQSQVDQWIDFTHNNLQSHVFTILRATFGWAVVESDCYNNAVKELKDFIRVLNTHLQGKDFLVGSTATVADVVAAITLIPAYQTSLDGGFRKAMPNVTSWLERFIALPEVINRLGHIKFAAKIIKPQAPPKKEEKKEAAPAKKAEKKDDDDEGHEEKKKERNPLDMLPPSKFVLPDFKTFFVNLPDRRADGIPKFFEQYDPEGYCIYFCHYDKYEGEGVVLYQTSNLMNGFLQRIDNFRQHTFSMMAILGEEPNLEIQGVWMFRGKGIPQEMLDHPQFEYYKKRELDVNNEDDKKLIADFWCAKPGETVNGLVVQECKMHK